MTDFYTTGITNTTGKVKLVDGDGNVYDLDVKLTEGGQEYFKVSDEKSSQLLTDILKELKKLNLHMSLMTDVNITNQEVA